MDFLINKYDKVFCECGKLICRGEIRKSDLCKNSKLTFHFEGYTKPKGTIIKNGSNNYKDWKFICGGCQKKLNVEIKEND